MLYRALSRFMSLVVRTFFRRVEVIGQTHIPADGPVIFAGNHPNALMDGLLVMTQCGREPVHFLGNAKLWRIPGLRWLLDTLGAIPVYPREADAGHVDNRPAFARVHDVLESGGCMGIFPEGISHTASQLTRLKTGTARLALSVAAERGITVAIVPCGLTYVHRHRFRSQALVHFGAPILIEGDWLSRYAADEVVTVNQLTAHLQDALTRVTLNAPDWDTLRFIHTARRLYKPAGAALTPDTYVELSRRFIDHYLKLAAEPRVTALRREIEEYQARLDLLGLKDHQVSNPIQVTAAMRRVAWRMLVLILLVPLAIPGAVIHLPIAWAAAAAGSRFSYDLDDIATLKVATAMLLLPLLYLVLAAAVGYHHGALWGALTFLVLPLSFFATLAVMETQAQLLLSTLGTLRVTRLYEDVEALACERQKLVESVRRLTDSYADPALRRIFTASDFESAG
jgi:1-acyl-sn-glycerol-3-phosphate acyltransferase